MPGVRVTPQPITLYLARMSEGERAVPRPQQRSEQENSERRAPAAQDALDAEVPERERYGPLEVERTRKDDGRVLIYYSGGEPSN